MSSKSLLRRLPVLVGAALVVLVAAEGAARWLEPRMSVPAEYHSQETAEKVAALDRFGDDVDVVFAGTSQVLQGIAPEVVDAARGGGFSYNAALSGAVPDLQRRWLPDQVLARSDPTVVVWGVSPLIDLRGPDESEPFLAYEEARATRAGTLADLDRALSDRFALARLRPELRSPAAVLDAVRGRPPIEEPASTNGPRGNRLVFVQTVRPSVAARLAELLSPGASSVQRDDLFATVDELRAEGVEVVLVEMPVAPRLYGYLDVGAAEYEVLADELAADLAERGVEFLRPDERFRTDVAFLDYTHFSEPVATDFSTWIGEYLSAR